MLIGIMGLMGAGKDTVADFLVDEKNFTKMSFADSLKDVTASVFGWDREMVEGSTVESRAFRDVVDPWWTKELGIKDFTPRKAMQLIGTELFRTHFHGDIWVKNTMMRASKEQDVVIADVRFVNEAQAIVDAGGILIRVAKGGTMPIWHNVASQAMDGDHNSQMYMESHYEYVHCSEWNCINVDANVDIMNDGSLHDLRAKILNTLTAHQ